MIVVEETTNILILTSRNITLHCLHQYTYEQKSQTPPEAL